MAVRIITKTERVGWYWIGWDRVASIVDRFEVFYWSPARENKIPSFVQNIQHHLPLCLLFPHLLFTPPALSSPLDILPCHRLLSRACQWNVQFSEEEYNPFVRPISEAIDRTLKSSCSIHLLHSQSTYNISTQRNPISRKKQRPPELRAISLPSHPTKPRSRRWLLFISERGSCVRG
jgi:hypothetical protein